MGKNQVAEDSSFDEKNSEKNSVSEETKNPLAEEASAISEADDLTDEERAEKERKAKRQARLQPLKYFLCAASAGVIQFVSALVLHSVLDNFIDRESSIFFIVELNEITFIADTVGLGLSIFWNFTLNRKFTFKDAGNIPIAMLLAFLFYVPFYPFQIWYIDTIEKALLASTGGELSTFAFIIAQGTCMAYNLVLEFLWQKFVVFRKKRSD
ncbi:MAG: hypothetical protein IJ226_01650 [Clostridia bacterium]|nr:hypothetical protein [Clostridia bacterium]